MSKLASLLAQCTALLIAAGGLASAQDLGTVDPKPLPPVEHPDANTPAKQLFGRKTTPVPLDGAVDRLLHHGCLRRRRGAAGQRPDLAGDAAVAEIATGAIPSS